jgi:hypothetical protein
MPGVIIKTTVRTERSGEVYLTEHDLAVIIGKFFSGATPEITTYNLDWDISQGALVKGVFVKWAEVEPARTVEKEL